jgi:activator of HSP90 ATPase
MYLDAGEHAKFTGMPVELDARPGGAFKAFGGRLEGTILSLMPGRLIVQRWRSIEFKRGDLDSTLILTFNKKGKGCRLDLVHVNVPEHDFKGVTEGWRKYYWEPLKKYLKKPGR